MAYKRIKRVIMQHLGENRHERRKREAIDRSMLRRLKRAMKRERKSGKK